MSTESSGAHAIPSFVDDAVREGQLLVLEQIAAGDALESVLATLCVLVEQAGRGTRVVCYVADASGALSLGAAPYGQDGIDDKLLDLVRGSYASKRIQVHEQVAVLDDPIRARAALAAVPVLGPDSSVLGVFGVAHEGDTDATVLVDFAQQYSALASVAIRNDERERSLRRSQAALEEAQRVGRFGDVTVDLGPETTHWSAQTYRLYGLDDADPIPAVDQFVAWHQGSACADLRRMLTGAMVGDLDVELAVDREGRPLAYHRFLLSRSVRSDGRVRVTGTVHDVTERRRTEEAFQQAQRLESVGLLAGGIAHDFNNLLAAMLANIGLLERRVASDEGARKVVNSMDRIVHRATDLTRQILTYAGKSSIRSERVEVDSLTREMTSLLSAASPRDVRIRLSLAAAGATTSGDPAQLQQVVMNLVKNAIDSIGERAGSVEVRSRVVTLDAEALEAAFPGQAVRPGRFVETVVEDDGCGMSAETLTRIFDPFFTTKSGGRGLGLSAVRGILKSHGAGCAIDSAIGRGTTFRVVFPLVDDVANKRVIRSDRPIGAAAGRLLLVDDEAVVRDATAEALALAGYEILLSADGEEASEALDRSGPFDAVISDLRMPGVTGLDLYERLRGAHPSCPFILCTGYRGDADLTRLDGDALAVVIEKPVRAEELVRSVERLRGATSA